MFIISGPSGAGKGTIVEKLLEQRPELYLSVSATTRKRRRFEKDQIHYSFLTDNQFDQNIKENRFLEWAQVHKKKYGTLAEPILKHLEIGHNVILEIDVQGAEQVRRKMPNACAIFIEPPSFRELEKRLSKRGSEKQEQIQTRLKAAENELKLASQYDFRIINDDLGKAVEEVIKAIDSRCRRTGSD